MLENLVRQLLARRVSGGYWEGRLSSSALSTATAIGALVLAGKKAHEKLVAGGLSWLAENQNADGGWGDTTRSISNISTTSLCWATFSLAGRGRQDAAETWLKQAAGSLDPIALANAIIRRYGGDRTFSVPILTTLALAGRLDWSSVPQLPFELAALPQRWFHRLRLPVVSYALPALIAMGLVRHRRAPGPLARFLRDPVADKTLRLLDKIHPASGGFLEAVPLTSFVVMSLIAAGERDHPVVQRGLRFLIDSVRPDGSWPIDTNLATWVTTLAVNAMVASECLTANDKRSIRDWLLGQQYRGEHPYTGAAPGGWAWTDLPGGVPDADDTAGALLALSHVAGHDEDVRRAAQAGVSWLLGLQNRDGGIPTFCRGWTKLPFDRSSPDITAHALAAWSAWHKDLPAEMQRRVERATRRAVQYLAREQRQDGAWVPLWFGNQFAPADENPTYGTSRVLAALQHLSDPGIATLKDRAVRWLLAVQNPDGGWGGAAGVESSIEETSLALSALAEDALAAPAVQRAVDWLITRTDGGRCATPAPIGFYFAKLWYYEELYPLIFAIAGLARARATFSRLPVV